MRIGHVSRSDGQDGYHDKVTRCQVYSGLVSELVDSMCIRVTAHGSVVGTAAFECQLCGVCSLQFASPFPLEDRLRLRFLSFLFASSAHICLCFA